MSQKDRAWPQGQTRVQRWESSIMETRHFSGTIARISRWMEDLGFGSKGMAFSRSISERWLFTNGRAGYSGPDVAGP